MKPDEALDHELSKEKGKIFTANWRSQYSALPHGFSMPLSVIDFIAQQSNVTELKIYMGINEDGEMTLVYVGCDQNGNDNTDYLADWANPCPPRCGVQNFLNSDANV